MKQINVLPLEEIKYVKIISFEVEVNGELRPAIIAYKRSPSKQYTMDESKRSDLDRLLYVYPEESYPRDKVDELILEVIKDACPDAKVSTSLMLCDVEKEHLERLLSSYSKRSFTIDILPRVRNFEDVINSGKTSWRCFEKKLPLYVHLKKEDVLYIRDTSTIYYDIENEENMQDLEPTLLGDVLWF